MTSLSRYWPALVAALAAACSSADRAAPYPSRTIDIVVPFPPGGGSDNLARTVQDIVGREQLSAQAVTVSNRSGGSGAVGLAYVAARRGDGYTLVTLNDPLVSLSVQPHYTGPTLRDLTIIAILALDEMAIVVPMKSTFQTIDEVIAFAKANPGKLTFSTEAQGGGDHVLGILVERATGASFTYVHTRGGAEAMQNLVGGHVDLAGPNPSEMLSQWKAGLVRPLVVSAPARIAMMPDVPTLEERGIRVVHRMMRGVALPGGAPPDALRFWEDALARLAGTERWRTHYLERFALTPYFKTGDEARAFLKRHEALNRDALTPAEAR
ncbi:MAG: tripartite tricarboxylate transporter substrate binding protein [Vicinamibacterales bacterium]